MTSSDHGGKPCTSMSESGECNMDSCDQDCVLSDWTGWGPCSKACLAKSTWLPGTQTRSKSIKEPTVGGGFCPKPIECVADLDIVIVHDGSGSLWYRWGGKSMW